MGIELKGAILDVDGTLIDSMPVWHNCGARYLAGLGIEAEPGLGDYLFTQTNESGAYYLIERYSLDKTPEEVAEGLSKEMEKFYFNEAKLKKGARELLDSFKDSGVPMTVATSTDRYLIEKAFEELDIAGYFKKVLTCPEEETTKADPLIFNMAAELMGTSPEDTWVFEDGLYAIRTAKEAGFRTVAVYDPISESDWEGLKELADISVAGLDEFIERYISYAG